VHAAHLELELPAVSARLALARHRIREFCERVPVDEEVIERVQIAVHEAATNSVVHGYDDEHVDATYMLEARVASGALVVIIHDYGVGMTAASALPTKGRGLGLALIHALCDHANVTSQPGYGTRVEMQFRLGRG
jgi:stage II sporulation protein AB (anti-sigma F factor)